MAVKSTSNVTRKPNKAPAKKPAAPKGKIINKATGKTELPPSFSRPGKKRGKDIPDD